MGPDLSFVQARISADQDALATTLSIEDKDSPGTGVTFAQEMPSPAAVYFLEQELLTLARLGEQGFAVTVLGENLGTINETKSGLYTTLNVTNWGISVKTGAEVYIEQSDDTLVKVTLSADAPKGSTSISFASASIDVTAGDRVKPSGTVNRADFQVTADAITAYLGNPGDVIATLSADSTWDGTRTTLPCSGGTSEDLEAKDPVLIYTQLGSVVKGIVNVDTASGATSIVLSSTSGNLTASAKSGDKVVPGSVTGLRIDMDGIEVRADEIRSSNYSAGSAGWLIEADGDAFFNDISARGSIVITGGSGISNFSDAGAGVTWDNADNIPDGSTKRVTTTNEATGAGRAFSAIDASNFLTTAVTPGSNLGASPGSAGLYLGSDYLGYYDGGNWKTFMQSNGNFYLGGTGGSLVWSSSTNELSIAGSVTITGGSGIGNLTDAGALAEKNTIDTDDIDNDAITTVKIADGQITADKISVTSLSAIQANIGDLTMAADGSIVFAGGGSLTPRSLQAASGTLSLGGQSINIGSGLIVASEDSGSVTIAGTSTGPVSIGSTAANMSLTTTTSGNISLTSAGDIALSAGGSITAGGNGLVTEGGAVNSPSLITSDTVITIYVDGTAYEINAEAV
jgi:hypothetical protein